MDKLPDFGTAIGDVVMPTYQAYMPLLLAQVDTIKSTSRESFTYGKHPRQQLDVYTPSNAAQEQNRVLVFLYGGGLVRGDKINPISPQGLVYANLGHFFAENLGCKVVIPDYRLISHGAKFPSGGEDLELVLEWVKNHIDHDSTKPLDLYIMGNSAGGIHTATYLFATQIAESRTKILAPEDTGLQLKGVVFLAVPFHFGQSVAERAETLQAYYGNDVREWSPLGLLKSSIETGSVKELKDVAVLVLTGTLDPKEEILVPNEDFVKEWRTVDAIADNLSARTIKGHNHISPVLALGTGIPDEEAWGHQVVKFINEGGIGSQ